MASLAARLGRVVRRRVPRVATPMARGARDRERVQDQERQALGVAVPMTRVGMGVRGWFREWAMPALVLGLLSALLFFRHIGELGLYSDDWQHLYMAADQPLGELARQWPLDFRPLDPLPWLIGYRLVGLSLGTFYAALFLVVLANGVLLYAMARRLCGEPLLALGVAATWLVYPADQSVFWLSCLHYRLGLFFLLLGLVLLDGGRGGRVRYAGAVACCALCLATNELFLGLLLAMPALAAWRGWQADTLGGLRRAAGVAAPFLALIAAYLAYRVWLGPRVLGLPDGKGGQTALSASWLARIEGRGLVTVLLQGWDDALAALRLGALRGFVPSSYEARAMITASPVVPGGFTGTEWTLLEVYLATVALAGAAWMRRGRRAAMWTAVRPGALAMCVGLAWIAAGFLALSFTQAQPTLNGIASRIDAAALPGAALFMVGMVWVLARWLPLPGLVGRALFLIGIVTLVTVGTARSERTAAAYTAGWARQRALWGLVVRAAPGLRAGTFVVLAAADGPGDDVVGALRPWGVGPALSLLYGRRDIWGDMLQRDEARRACDPMRDADQDGAAVQVATAGLLPHGGAVAVPFGRVLVLRYWGAAGGRVAVVRGSLGLGRDCALPSHSERIRGTPEPDPEGPWQGPDLIRNLT